jgi:inorganic pyrophosphatase
VPPRKVFRVVIETPAGSRNKYTWDPRQRAFELGKVLPEGMVFPYDFGFVPRTRGGDGDPIDVLVLMDYPAFPGCRLDVRAIGVVQGEQVRKKGKVRNDRLIAVAVKSHRYAEIRTLEELGEEVVAGLEQFFTVYHLHDRKKFEVVGKKGPRGARRIIAKAARR